MHVALLANTAWLDEELTLLRHLVVGLMDEQVRVAQVLPDTLPADDSSTFGDRLTWRDTSWSMLRRRRLAKLAPRLDELEIDLVHALDGRMWAGAVAIAQQLKVPALLWAWSLLDVAQVERYRGIGPDVKLALAATTRPIYEAILERAPDGAIVEFVPPGVRVPEEAANREEDEALCAVVSGNGQFDHEYDALFEAMRHLVNEHPHAQFFFDGQGADQHALWSHARRYGLLSNMSMVPRRLGHRELLLRADVLIHPQPLGKARSLTLQAMAVGLPLVARSDPWLDYLLDDQTAWLVEQPDPKLWDHRLRALLSRRQHVRDLCSRARAWIAQNRTASNQIDSTLALYRRLAPQAIKFPVA